MKIIEIMKKLLDKISEVRKENQSLRVYLGASKDKETFYEKFGFIKREEANLGAGMIVNRVKQELDRNAIKRGKSKYYIFTQVPKKPRNPR